MRSESSRKRLLASSTALIAHRVGIIAVDWQNKPHRLAQKDTDARWTKKRGVSHFGYKNHISIDVEYGLIRQYQVTDAAVHDLQVWGGLLDEDNRADSLWADSAYRSEVVGPYWR